jgi:Flp pilus assembly protein TadG
MNTKSRNRNWTCDVTQAGQAMVEFMLVTVFLLIVFVSMLQMIMLMYAYSTLADAAKEGVRYAIVHGTGNTVCSGPGTTGPPAVTCPDIPGNNVKTAVQNFANLSFQNISKTTEITVDYNPNSANGSNQCNVPGCLVRVTVSHAYRPLFGLGWPRFNLNAAADGRIMN